MADLISISITELPEKIEYFSEEEFNSAGLIVTARYYDPPPNSYQTGTYFTTKITSYILRLPTMINNGTNNITQNVTVIFQNQTASFLITIKPLILKYLKIERLPHKVNYFTGDIFDITGLEVIGYYDDEEITYITDYNPSIPNMNIAGTQTVTVSYQEKTELLTTTFDIYIERISITSLFVSEKPNKLTYFVGETFSYAGLEVTAIYNNNTWSIITNYILIAPNMNIIGAQTVTVTYENATTSFTIGVSEIPVSLDINAEFWQHFRFRMPDDNLTINLKWIERLFLIDFFYKERTVDIAPIKDTNKVYDINKFNGDTEDLRQLRLPHYTYPKVLIDYLPSPQKPRQNIIKLKLTLTNDAMQIFSERSFCKFGNNYQMIEYPLPNNKILDQYGVPQDIVTIDEEKKSITVIVPKYSVKTFLDIGYYLGVWVCKDINFNTGGSIFLDKGKYKFWVRAANGGHGGFMTGEDPGNGGPRDTGWKSGGGASFSLTLSDPINLNYKLGSAGQDGVGYSPGNRDSSAKGGGGGGGGGTTILTFSEDVILPFGKRKEFCWGGGRGGDGERLDKWFNYEFGGDGGNGGNAKTGSGKDGQPGSDSAKEKNGNNWAGLIGGSGGIGFSSKTDTLVGPVGSPTGDQTEDGFLFIRYEGE